jgi:gliding motility-associated protein GldL
MGFNIGEIVQTKGWKKFMAKVYGWGASVVLIGAMFKIMHWTGSGIMLVIGLSTEAFIFFTSAFEPLHVEHDWSLVYPELAGLHEDVEELDGKKKIDSKKSALEKFDAMIENAEISPELFQKLGSGLKNLNTTTEKISDISNVTVATNNYINNFEKASEKVLTFSDAYSKSADSINNSASNLSQSYIKTSELVTNSGKVFADKVSNTGVEITELVSKSSKNLADSYAKLTESINVELTKANTGNKTYAEQLGVMTKNLAALNAVYELQLQESNEHLDASKKLYDGLNHMMENLHVSIEDSKIYREEVSKLGKNLSAMNVVYGNMLSALNVNRNA